VRLLDLFCGAGGAAVGYHRAGFDEIVGVDIDWQPHYPFEFVQADALSGLVEDMLRKGQWDLVHASPPCQAWTAYRRRGHSVGDSYPELVNEIRGQINRANRPYVIENVYGAPLRAPIQLCGSSFGLDVRRHRLFEASWMMLAPPCDHSWQTPRFPQATNRKNLRSTVEIGVWRIPLETQKRAMGVDWPIELRELSEAIPPAYTEWIGSRFLEQMAMEVQT